MGLLNARRGSGQALDVDTVSTCLRVLSDVQVRVAHWVYAIVLYLTNPCLAPGALSQIILQLTQRAALTSLVRN